ncbi:hypothetical protein SNOG_12728 [Parastagonospora nodorum SN15]|uniref:Uncharacterized protein n=1 Tax=Phaeosphaeria nodorum (strain SN15 / ATCC MYA-4574 / FGSC 10173) TaxID=321614 RepID=Q0U686_PHANO|nr:hypothetical protein SNOG_12728 [Parastagonospora nodorum SN15]EAT80026.1 hypothetical protein SNOG_12728 [Parastagonospora nodorum SN15]
MITTAALNISCSCTECNSFLRPISESTTPQGSGKEQTKSKIQDLYSPLEIDADHASREYMSIMTAFTAPFVPFVPTTPGLLRCTHVISTERIPVVPGLGQQGSREASHCAVGIASEEDFDLGRCGFEQGEDVGTT